ncbi:MAG: alpha/beta hydrolase [Gemmataceae bacterium]
MGRLRQKSGRLGCQQQPKTARSHLAVLTALLLLLGIVPGAAQADAWRDADNGVRRVNRYLSGKVIDHTANHGKERRMWSRNLWQRRDLYVYLPPNYTPKRQYPLMIWLHGFYQDEKSFLKFIPLIDEAIREGKLPPIIVAAPDGSHNGVPQLKHPGSFFLNSDAGPFSDFVMVDMWDFVIHQYSVSHDRRAHVLAGYGMGGFAAYNLAIKHRNAFGVAIGILPPLNLRWTDKRGNRAANFDPKNWDWDVTAHPGDVVARGISGGRTVHLGDWTARLFGIGLEAVPRIAAENPIEMIDRYQVQPGQLEMYVAYSGRDEYNIDAQVNSFLYLAKWRGLGIGVGYDPHGRHNVITAKKLLPGALQWLSSRLSCLAPPRVYAVPPPDPGNLAAIHYGPNRCHQDTCTPDSSCEVCRYKKSVQGYPVKDFLREQRHIRDQHRLPEDLAGKHYGLNCSREHCTLGNSCEICGVKKNRPNDPVRYFLQKRRQYRSQFELPQRGCPSNCGTGGCEGNCPNDSFCPDCLHKRMIPDGAVGTFIRKNTKYRSNFRLDSNLNYGFDACQHCGEKGFNGTSVGSSWDCPNCSSDNPCQSCCQKKRRLSDRRKSRRHTPECLPPATENCGPGCVCLPPPSGIDRLPD